MFKFTTTVKLVLCTALSICTPFAWGEDGGNSAVNDCTPLQQEWLNMLKSGDPHLSDVKAELDQCQNASSTSSATISCSNATEQFNTAQRDFLSACAAAHLTYSGTGGDIGCSAQMSSCDTAASGASAIGAKVPYNADGAAQLIRQCPVYAGANLKDLQDQINQHQQRKDDLQKQIDDLNNQVMQNQNQASQQQSSLQKEIVQAQAEHSKETQQIVQQGRDQAKQVQSDVNSLIASRTEKENEINAHNVNIVKVGNDLSDQKAKITQNCYSVAAAQVGQQQQQYLEAIKTGQPIKGTQQDQFKRVGMTSRQAWQKEMNKYYQWCITSQPTAAERDSANRAYLNSLNAEEASKKQNTDQIANVNTQIQQKAVEAAQNQADMKKNLQTSEDDFRAQQNAAQQELQVAATNSQQQQAQLQSEIAKRRAELTGEQTTLTNIQQYYNLKNQTSNGMETDPSAVSDVFGKYAALKDVAAGIYAVRFECPSKTPYDAMAKATQFLKKTNSLPDDGGSGGETSTPRTPTSTGGDAAAGG